MKNSSNRPGERAQTQLPTLAVLFLALGFGAGIFCYWRYASTRAAKAAEIAAAGASTQTSGLSDATKSVLKRLNGPVEIRYYSILDPTGASDSLRAFAGRVDQLLTEYQQEAGGNLKVVRHNSPADDSPAALADGLKPFNLDKGEGCYLGIVVVMGAQKEMLPQLAPEWEQAVEPDVTRAIARLEEAPQPGNATTVAMTAPPNAKVVAEVKAAIPDYAAMSLENGTRALRTAAVGEYTAAAGEMAAKLKDAQQRLVQAQNGGTEAEQQAAMKNLQELQAAQAAKLREIASQSQALIQAFTQLKQSAK